MYLLDPPILSNNFTIFLTHKFIDFFSVLVKNSTQLPIDAVKNSDHGKKNYLIIPLHLPRDCQMAPYHMNPTLAVAA